MSENGITRAAKPAEVMHRALAASPAYVLVLLLGVTLLNYYDRSLIYITLPSIKSNLHLSDSQAGLLAGPAFSMMYALLGIPIARLADRGYRVRVLSLALTVWSLMTVMCGMAMTLPALFLARLGVGVGEAGGLPATHAIAADHFQGTRRAAALTAIATAAGVGAMGGTFLGGVLVGHRGWRAAYGTAGIPGVLLALVLLATVRERRRNHGYIRLQAPFGEALRALWHRRAYVFLCAGLASALLSNYALEAWTPTFYLRAYHFSTGELGLRYSLIKGIPDTLGTLMGGVIATRWMHRDERSPVWMIALSFAAAIPFQLMVFLSESARLSFIALIIASFCAAFWVGPTYTMIQGLAGGRLRATAAAAFMLIVNLVGVGPGPWIAGGASDALASLVGVESLRYALCLMLIFAAIGSALVMRAAPYVIANLREANCA